MNLVNNAVIHGFEGRSTGTVTIEGRRASAGSLELIVSDDGIGIAPEHLNRIYDPFFTTKLGAGSSGLGLNITHNIVTGVLGGHIQVESTLNVGTRFIIVIPAEAPHGKEAA
jgi:signal transduction histidine kinase